MAEINLDDWAAKKGIRRRTAQHWAKKMLIPAKKATITKTVVKTFKGYVIDEDAAPPRLSS